MPSSATFPITADVRDVLARSSITATAVTLPAQLERKLYERVNKVLTGAGGKWSRRDAAHVFHRDPREVLGLAVETGTAVNLQKKFQAYYTPDALARRVVALAGDLTGKNVLEPSAGGGAIARCARFSAGAKVTCVELDDVAARGLAALGFNTLPADFLTLAPDDFQHPFDAVVMNPPFTGDEDLAHVRHALRFLRPGGRLVAIVSPRFQFIENTACREFRALIEQIDGRTEEVPAGTFAESGTDIRTVIVSLRTPDFQSVTHPCNASMTATDTPPPAAAPAKPHRPQGQRLDGDNLQEVLDAGRNAAQVGRQQFFTAPDVAAALATALPECAGQGRETVVDLTMGNGSLLLGAGAAFSLGVDIDSRCARRPAGAAGHWHTVHADLTRFFPLLAEVGFHADLFALNPPFSVQWHADRLAALADSECPAVADAFKTFVRGKDHVDSTLATFMMALDRMTTRGEGYLLCNESTALRFFGSPDSYGNVTDLRAHVWTWLTVPPGLFADAPDFTTAVLYFARSHRSTDTLHLTAEAPTAEAIAEALQFANTVRYSRRQGQMIYQRRDFDAGTVPAFQTAAAEFRARADGAAPREFNLWLGDDGLIRRHLTPFQQASVRIPKADAAALDAIEGESPLALVVLKETRLALLRAVRSTYWLVDPKLTAAVDAAVAGYHANRAPYYPLNEVQRLGWLDEEDCVTCRKDWFWYTSDAGAFTAGKSYPITCSSERTEREHKRPNIFGVEEKVTLAGQELVITVTDNTGHPHQFRPNPKRRPDGSTAAPNHDPANHDLAAFLAHFHAPEVPDVSVVHADRYEANRAALRGIEASLQARGIKLTHHNYQAEDLARLAVHPGGILSWDPGLGKTLAAFSLPQVWAARRVLLVVPESLHEQFIETGRDLFGITVRRLRNQDDYEADELLTQAAQDRARGIASEVSGYWITSYSALGYNGGDEWKPRKDEFGDDVPPSRPVHDRRRAHPCYDEEFTHGIGQVQHGTGIRCVFAPTLATLTADLFDCVECDEGVRLKSNESFISLGVRRMRPAYRCVLTGTPIKNHLDDLFWLAHWAAGGSVDPTERWPYAGTNAAKESFASMHMMTERNHTREAAEVAAGKPKRTILKRIPTICNLHRLWKLLAPVIVRRRKDDIGQAIVPKTIVPLRVLPGTAQQAVYRFHAANRPLFNHSGEPMAPIAQVIAQLTNLRQAALCPDTPNLSESAFSVDSLREWLRQEAVGAKPADVDALRTRKAALVAYKGERTPFPAEAAVAFEIVERMVNEGRIDLEEVFRAAPSLRDRIKPLVAEARRAPTARSWTDHNPKQAAILQLACELLPQGEQLVVMSPFQRFGETLAERLREAGVSCCLLDGNTSPAKRGRIAREFKQGRFAVLIGGQESMGEGHSFENCAHLVLPSISWAFDKNRQSEDRVHRITSRKPVTIYVLVTSNTVDVRLESVYREKADSSNLALDGRLFADRTGEVNLGELLASAIRDFDPAAPTADEADIEREWEGSLKARLRAAEAAFRQWHPPIIADIEGGRVTPSEVRRAAAALSIPPCVSIVKCVPSAMFAHLIETTDPEVVARCREEFIAFCIDTQAKDWRPAWAAFRAGAKPAVVSESSSKALPPSAQPPAARIASRDENVPPAKPPAPRVDRAARARDFFKNL